MILLPTLNRIEKLKASLKTAIDTHTSEPGLILVDPSDFRINQKAYEEVQEKFCPENWQIKVVDAVSMGDKCRAAWPFIKDRPYAMIVNDDFEYVTPRWDKLLVSKLDGKNFVSANDQSVNAFRLPVTATAWSMPLLNCLGWSIYPPHLQHLFIDNLWRDIGRATGCWHMVASAIVRHKHVIFGKAEADSTHHKVYNQESWSKDEAVYQHIMQHQFNDLVTKVRSFQGYAPGEQWNPEKAKSQLRDRLMAP